MKNLNKIKTFQILTIVSIIGMICWNITDYFGGMIIHLLQYWYLIIPIIILYIITFIKTLIEVGKSGFKNSKLTVVANLLFIVFILTTNLIESDVFKSKRVLSGTLKDDLFHYTLIFREDGNCENNINGFLGYKKQYKGTYKRIKDTIIFIKKPYENNFIPDTLFYDKNQNAIFINKNKQGRFNIKKEWLNHFELE